MKRRMKNLKNSIVVASIFFCVATVFFFFSAVPTHAQEQDFGLGRVEQGIDLGAGDAIDIVLSIIRIALGLLGIIAVIIVLYGGFVYMTSRGEQEGTNRAKQIMVNGAIGLAIIMSAFAIVQFVIFRLAGATGIDIEQIEKEKGGRVCDVTSPDYNRTLCEALCAQDEWKDTAVCRDAVFYVKSITPSTPNGQTTRMNNVTVRAIFSHPLNPATDASRALQIRKDGELVNTQVSLIEGGRVLEAISLGAQGEGQNVAQGLFTQGNFSVSISAGITDIVGDPLVSDYEIQGRAYPLSAAFTVDAESDDQEGAPIGPILINGLAGVNKVYQNDPLDFDTVIDDVTDEFPLGGVGLVMLRIVDKTTGAVALDTFYTGPHVADGSTNPFDFSYKGMVEPARFSVRTTYEAAITAFDIDGNSTRSSIEFTVFASHCQDDEKNGDETDIDIGGSCGGGIRDACTEDADCAGFFACSPSGMCVPQTVILQVDPWNGKEGSWVTVMGKNFGTVPGLVEFGYDTDADLDVDENDTAWIPAGIAECSNKRQWANEWVIAEVPQLSPDEKAWAIRVTNVSERKEGETVVTKENAEDAGTAGWSAEGEGVIERVPDPIHGNVIRMEGAGLFGLTNSDGSLWQEIERHVIEWDMKSEGNQQVFVVVQTDQGNKSVHYASVIRELKGEGIYARIPLPVGMLDGGWHTVRRDVQKDLEAAFPGIALERIDRMQFSGSGRMDNIRLVSATPPQDSTADAVGPLPNTRIGEELFAGYFTENNIDRPGLCAVVADGDQVIDDTQGEISDGATEGPPKTNVKALGRGFGEQSGQARFLFGAIVNRATGEAVGGVQGGIRYWGDTSIGSRIPNLDALPKSVGVHIQSGNGAVSNGVPFLVSAASYGNRIPKIDEINPSSVTPGSFITISGTGFDGTGKIYIADSKDHVETCFSPQADARDPSCRLLNVTDFPAGCVDPWSGTEVIAEIPLGTPSSSYRVMLENGSGLRTSGDDQLTVIDGTPRPSICSLEPNAGPAPRLFQMAAGIPQGGVTLIGKNFTPDPTVYFWRNGASPDMASGWLSVSGDDRLTGMNDAGVLQNAASYIRTPIPQDDARRYSMDSGPIHVVVNGEKSNPVRYTVTDCRDETAARPGFQCCAEGDDEGRFIPENQLCAGATRDAGYVWRFTSGLIPLRPKVSEFCEDGSGIHPSPTPWETREDGKNVCVNADISLIFDVGRAPNAGVINGSTITKETVRLYRCPETGGAPDCAENKRIFVDNDYALDMEGNKLTIRRQGAGEFGRLQTNTWYHVELLEGIEAIQPVFILNQPETKIPRPLEATRPCGTGTVYCFNFKTSPTPADCELANAFINPKEHITTWLGPLEDALNQPFYHLVWGEADQACTVIDVDDKNWQWGTEDDTRAVNERRASAAKAAGDGYANARGHATALANTAPDSVEITATYQPTIGDAIVAESDLTVKLGPPRVIAAWPQCQEACTNAVIGMSFNRDMLRTSYAGGVTLEKCTDGAACRVREPVQVASYNANSTRRYEVQLPNSELLAQDSWYVVTAKSTILSLRRLPDIPGDPLIPFSWKFKTKAEACAVNTVSVEPDPYVTREVGNKKTYRAMPLSVPDSCGTGGQQLNASQYGWEWQSSAPLVASVSQFQTLGAPPAFCSDACLPLGSFYSTSTRPVALCGDQVVGPGEDCDLGLNETLNATCTSQCVRPGKNAPLCGNRQIDAGEECDGESFCTNQCLREGSSRELAEGEGSPENLPATCGDGAVEIDKGEECEVGRNGETDATCTERCLHRGSILSLGWCEGLAG
ncbi:MAG: hypothetical protein AAB932_04065, partial [Patescibacteria group bacterium]